MKTKTLLCAASLSLAACGSYAEDPGAPTTIAKIQGDVKNPDSLPAPSSFRVALIWTGEPYNVASELSVVPKFPASFQLEIHDLPPKSAMQTEKLLPGLQIAVGAVVGYEDLNGNGKLDMVDSGAAEFVDRVWATNENRIVLYTTGSKDAYDALPEEFGAITPGFGLLDIQAAEGSVEIQFLPLATSYDLVLDPDPSINELMCKSPPGSSGGGTVELQTGQPSVYPDPQDPNLTCDEGGAWYVLNECQTISEGPCKGTTTSCVGQQWFRPEPVPALWPCQ